jgi:hypothetical protein
LAEALRILAKLLEIDHRLGIPGSSPR